jgi:hypothetical protein
MSFGVAWVNAVTTRPSIRSHPRSSGACAVARHSRFPSGKGLCLMFDPPRIGDAWGDALLAHLEGREGPDLVLEVDDGTSVRQ